MTDVASPDAPLVRATAQISLITAVARFLGLARWIVFGLTVGATYLGNTYQTANTVPNILYELAAGGVLSAVFVPTFVAEAAQGTRRAEEVASTLANLFLLISVPLVAGGMLLARPIMWVLTSGVADAATREREVSLGAWFLLFFLPQIPLYMLGMVMRGVAHANNRFALAAAAPAFSSVVVIASYLVFDALGRGADLTTVSDAQRWVLAVGTTAGIAAWTAIQVVPVVALGVRWRPVLRLADAAVRRALRSSLHGVAFYAVTQAGLVVTLVLANRVEGGVVAWQLAFAFYELPNAVAGFPFAVALSPALARHALAGEDAEFARLVSRGWRLASLLLVPAAAVLAVLSHPLARALGERAARAAPELVASALFLMVLGLPAYALQQSLARGFYARHESFAPVGVNAVTVGSYVVCAVSLTTLRGGGGAQILALVGLSHAAGQWAGLAAATRRLATRVRSWTALADVRYLLATAGRATVAAAAAWGMLRAASAVPDAVAVAAAAVAAVVVYAVVSLRVPEAREAAAALVGRRR